MTTQNQPATGKTSARASRRPAIWLRISLVLAIALALGSIIAARSTDASYENQLVDLALRQTHGPRSNKGPVNSIDIKALLLDYDHELAFKAQLALEKYGDDASDVLLRFGDDPSFQEVMRQYGENTIPVVAYFVKNDIASLRLIYLAEQKSDAAVAAAKEAWASFWRREDASGSTTAQIPDAYGPAPRGQRAIANILDDGHLFLGQFVLDPEGKAAWIQTERSAQAVKSLFLSGAINMEKKVKSGQPLEPGDFLNAGMDVFILVGAFKALKVLRATQQMRAVGVMKRTQLLGAPLLGKSALGRYAMKYGVAAGAVYLMARHPSLLSGVFVTAGKWLGLTPFLSKGIGWSALLAVLFVPLVALLALVLRILAATLGAASKALRWMLGNAKQRTSPVA